MRTDDALRAASCGARTQVDGAAESPVELCDDAERLPAFTQVKSVAYHAPPMGTGGDGGDGWGRRGRRATTR